MFFSLFKQSSISGISKQHFFDKWHFRKPWHVLCCLHPTDHAGSLKKKKKEKWKRLLRSLWKRWSRDLQRCHQHLTRQTKLWIFHFNFSFFFFFFFCQRVTTMHLHLLLFYRTPLLHTPLVVFFHRSCEGKISPQVTPFKCWEKFSQPWQKF